jgi:asparagine synthase (glutamine-hydrolysing)
VCGVCGIFNTGGDLLPRDGVLLERMSDSLRHRGPDDSGTYQQGPVALGHRRLSVIDLSRNGRQPMANEEESVWITYNGETYNFRELKARHRLEERGHRFRSRTDTEVLVHLYEELGPAMAAELDGMFAFALWDARSRNLHLFRDRFGIKPLFYTWLGPRLLFASEIKAILRHPSVPREVDSQALHDYLTFDYTPGDQTMFAGIRVLPPGHRMTVSADGTASIHRFAEFAFDVDQSLGEREAAAQSLELMKHAVERQLVSDVPIGVLLSGGLDSSALVALMRRQHPDEPIRTYSVGFEESSFDERPWARQVARHCGTIHREVVVTPETVRELLPMSVANIDEPYADGSAIPTYAVCGLAKEEVGVVLSGEGGDELFAGYATYAAWQATQWFHLVPRSVRNGLIAPLVHRLPVSDRKLSLEFRLKRFLGGQDLPTAQAHLWWRIVLTESEKWELYSEGVRERLHPEPLPAVRHFVDVYERSTAEDELNRLLEIDSSVFLPNDLMVKNDRMSMAHSLEARVPFTDLELVGFLAKVPPRFKLRGLRKKYLMRRALADLLPRSILNKKKVGLEMPYSRWLKHELRDLLWTHLDQERLEATGLFRPEPVRRLIEEHLASRRDNGRALWGLLNFMVWWESEFT